MRKIISTLLFSLICLPALADQLPVPAFLHLARNADGSPKLMTQQAAIEYCQDPNNIQQPAHLPSARELGQIAMTLGKNNGFVDSQCKHCLPFHAKNVDGTLDNFYFSWEGYHKPARDVYDLDPKDFGRQTLWSSSVDLGAATPGEPIQPIGFDVFYGGMGDYYVGASSPAVGCLSGR